MRFSALLRALAFAAMVGASSLAVPARAQDAVPAASVAAQEPAAPGEPSAAGTRALPRTDAPPRTLRAYWHLFAAFTIAWLLVFGYSLSLGRRFRRLEEQLDRLEPQA
jgi:CcmD family protein